MKRKLWLLNLALVAAIGAAGWQLRQQWRASQARAEAVLQHTTKPAPAPPLSASRPAEPVAAALYSEIAEKMLFSKDRNPTVVVEVQPQPPKPMPPLPALYGVMSLPDGPTAVMSEKSGSRHQGVRPGDQIGEFKLVAVNTQEIVLEWDGKEVTKTVEEMIDRAGPPAPAPAAESRAPGPAAPAKAPVEASRGQPAPGVDIGKGLRACQPGDTSPPGTVAGGMRKVVTETPFGVQCRWEPL